MPTNLRYILITPARNEAQYIELTLRSMVAQTCKPLKWIVVSDGSTDGTDSIVRRYAAVEPWIELLRMPERDERHFAGKVHAFETGYARVWGLEFELVGNLDADVSFEPDHFEYLTKGMAENPRLGIAGSPFVEGTFRYDYRFSNIDNVWGGCQLFRRACFEEIGGYMPLKGGCVDHVAVITARMKGWQTRTLPDRVCVHHRVMGTAGRSPLRARFRMGEKDYSVANHPLWEMARACYQMSKPPVVIGGAALAAGYVWSSLLRKERPVSGELAAFSRREQMRRLRRFVTGRAGSPVQIPVSDRMVSQ